MRDNNIKYFVVSTDKNNKVNHRTFYIDTIPAIKYNDIDFMLRYANALLRDKNYIDVRIIKDENGIKSKQWINGIDKFNKDEDLTKNLFYK